MKFVNGHIKMDPSRSVNFKTDPEVFEAAKEILSIQGISISAALNLYLSQIVYHKGIPFECTVGDVTDFIAIFKKEGTDHEQD